jgi:hypothetical protein
MLATMALCISQVSAQEDIAQGAGGHICAEYLDYYRQSPDMAHYIYTSWAQGYMAGANVTFAAATGTYRNLSSLTAQQLEQSAYRFCVAHPSSRYVDGITELWRLLPSIRLRESDRR